MQSERSEIQSTSRVVLGLVPVAIGAALLLSGFVACTADPPRDASQEATVDVAGKSASDDAARTALARRPAPTNDPFANASATSFPFQFTASFSARVVVSGTNVQISVSPSSSAAAGPPARPCPKPLALPTAAPGRPTLVAKSSCKAPLRFATDGDPNGWQWAGCKDSLDRFQGPVDGLYKGTQRRQDDHVDGERCRIVTLHETIGSVKSLRTFDDSPSRGVFETKFYLPSGAPDPNGSWGP